MNVKEIVKKYREKERAFKEEERKEKEERKRRGTVLQKAAITAALLLTVIEGVCAFSLEKLPIYISVSVPLLDPESLRQKVGIGWGIYYYKGGASEVMFLPQTTVLAYVLFVCAALAWSFARRMKKR